MRLERPDRDGKITFGIADKTDRLDILINNAARGIMTQQLAKKGVDLYMAQPYGTCRADRPSLAAIEEDCVSGKYCPNRKPRFERPRKCSQRHQIRVH